MSKDEDEMTISDWMRRAIGWGAIVELAKPVYMGRPFMKMNNLLLFFRAGAKASNSALMEKAADGVKELAEETGLEAFKGVLQEILPQNN